MVNHGTESEDEDMPKSENQVQLSCFLAIYFVLNVASHLLSFDDNRASIELFWSISFNALNKIFCRN